MRVAEPFLTAEIRAVFFDAVGTLIEPDPPAVDAYLAAGEAHGIRARVVSREPYTYVRDERGRMGPEPGKFADALVAWMIARHVAQELPLRPSGRSRATSTSTRPLSSGVTGY